VAWSRQRDSRQLASALPSWVPILGEERFEVNAQFTSAQAVTPGQGQAVTMAGIKVGDISTVHLENGQAQVSMEVDNDKAELIKEDASLLLRPKTGLNDMVIEVTRTETLASGGRDDPARLDS
jgi:phospholipid/cholesterol/gamma-HCH transport system substrate-binding protein